MTKITSPQLRPRVRALAFSSSVLGVLVLGSAFAALPHRSSATPGECRDRAIPIGRSPLGDGEPVIKTDPTDPNRALAAWTAHATWPSPRSQSVPTTPIAGALTLALRTGEDWSFKVIGPKTERFYWGDAWIDFSPAGRAYVTYLSVDLGQAEIQRKLHLRRVNPAQHDIGEELPNPFYMDHPAIAVDQEDLGTDHLYLVGDSEQGVIGDLLAESTDGGETWDAIVPFPPLVTGAPPVVASGGGRVAVATAADGVAAAFYDPDTNQFANETLLDEYVPFACEWGAQQLPSVSIARKGPLAGTAYVVWLNGVEGTDQPDVFLKVSLDGGVTWSERVKVNDDTEIGTAQAYPSVAAREDGRAVVAWMDGRDDDTGSTLQTYVAVVDENGDVGPNIRVTDCPTYAETELERTYGDYFVFDASQGRVDLVFPQIREPGGYANVYYLGWPPRETAELAP